MDGRTIVFTERTYICTHHSSICKNRRVVVKGIAMTHHEVWLSVRSVPVFIAIVPVGWRCEVTAVLFFVSVLIYVYF